MKLYFLRHGAAVDAAEWSGAEFDRPLTQEGRRRMEREAKTIARIAGDIERIVTSRLVRARDTATIVAEQLGLGQRLVEDERLGPGFSLERLGDILTPYREMRALMLVGHEPTLSATIGRLTGGSRVVMKKGSCARVDVHDPAHLYGDLVWLAPPKLLLP